MVPEKKQELKRVLCKIVEVNNSHSNNIEFDNESCANLALNSLSVLTNFGYIEIKRYNNSAVNYGIKISSHLAQTIGISKNDYLEVFNIDNSLYLAPILSPHLCDYFFNKEGAEQPSVILLSSHAEFEPYTREISTGIHLWLQKASIPSLRLEIRKHHIDWNQNFDATISRYEVDITRKEELPQIIARKLVNKNRSYRILAQTYFELLSKYLPLEHNIIVVDIHGIANASPKGIIHPMIIVGDALSRNDLVKGFTKGIEKASRTVLPNLWVVYNSKWGGVEYSLHLAKLTKNIPIIIEIRRDLRDNPETRENLINLIANRLENQIKKIQNFTNMM